MSTQFRLRKSVRNLTDSELQDFRDAIAELKRIHDRRGYTQIAGIHGYPDFDCFHSRGARWHDFGMRLFLPWHRAYLYNLEMSLNEINERNDLALPWWDWTSQTTIQEGLPQAYSDESLPNGDRNPLYDAELPLTSAGENGRSYRRSGDPQNFDGIGEWLADLLENNDFGSFSDQLQNLHGAIHVWVGGSMAEVDWAAYDPIFWAHHSMVDRIWRMWQLRHGPCHMPEEYLDVTLAPFNQTVRQVLNIYNMGYDYASSVVTEGGNI